MKHKKEKILIAGANGSTGKIIVSLLKDSDNYTPMAMVRKQTHMFMDRKSLFALREQDAVSGL